MAEIRRCRSLFDLPGEIRMIIYEMLLTLKVPIQIKRRPLRTWCTVEQKWLLIEAESAAHVAHQGHSGCRDQFNADICFRSDVQLHSSHFPCPKLLAGTGALDLNLLLVCRQIYFEARHIPYAKNTVMTAELSSFSNFLYSLRGWQAQSISHLSFNILEMRGMTKYLAEWNETFSLIAASCSNLQTVSIQVQLYAPRSACPSSFWDAGLLELDGLALAAIEFVLVDRYSTPIFIYVAGNTQHFLHSVSEAKKHTMTDVAAAAAALPSIESSHQVSSQQDRGFFHGCRDYLRRKHGYQSNNNADCDIFFRFSRNFCPLYVRNLIHLVPRRHRTHAQIRREDRLQRDYVYRNAYRTDADTGRARRIMGYQFGPDTPEDDITKNVEKLHGSQRRLAEKAQSGRYEVARRPHPVHQQRTADSVVHKRATTTTPSAQSAWGGSDRSRTIDTSPLGQWRRRLNEESFAPFIESFPPTKAVPQAPSDPPLYCAECTSFADDVCCFLSNEICS